jgi:hypothetical protein
MMEISEFQIKFEEKVFEKSSNLGIKTKKSRLLYFF